MRNLIDTTEMFLRTIHDLIEDDIPARQSRLAERLHQHAATVTQTVARMRRRGLVVTNADQIVLLTDEGRELAVAVTRKHRLAERLLVDVIGLPAANAHAEACRWEHVMSEAAERRIVEVLGHPTTSPWGNPIPGLDRIGVDTEKSIAPMRLKEIRDLGVAVTGTVACISEHAQADAELIAGLVGSGVIPGAPIVVTPLERSYSIRALNRIELPNKLAHIIRIDRHS